ncbi:MAG: hypothetical protein MUP97_11355 [Acidimicrobiia bacterium]|nr:hypothetical protein [Acidimicrobiia bacterium]
MKRPVLVVMLALALLAIVPAIATARDTAKNADGSPKVIVFNGQGNDLDAFASTPPFTTQKVYTTREKDPKGFDINAQICFFGDGRTFIAGEDTGQPDPIQGWGIFRLRGSKVGSLKARQVGKLQPTYQGATDNAENYGCGVLSDGRILTSDVGNQAKGDGDGQLIIWFPPLTKGFRTLANGTEGKVPYCKLDIGIATAGGIAVDEDDNVYVASARGDIAGVNRYSGPFPTSATPAGGCDGQDGTGAPMATNVTREQFIAPTNNLLTPNAIVPSPVAGSKQTGWYVSSVFTGVINEYDKTGTYVRTILQPPAGETLGAEPFSTGTPLGLGIGPDGTLYFADIGIVISDRGIGPGRSTGNVRRITFVGGEPQAPETMASGLAFPDGIGIFVPPRS